MPRKRISVAPGGQRTGFPRETDVVQGCHDERREVRELRAAARHRVGAGVLNGGPEEADGVDAGVCALTWRICFAGVTNPAPQGLGPENLIRVFHRTDLLVYPLQRLCRLRGLIV